jgi:hypothetical protein
LKKGPICCPETSEEITTTHCVIAQERAVLSGMDRKLMNLSYVTQIIARREGRRKITNWIKGEKMYDG